MPTGLPPTGHADSVDAHAAQLVAGPLIIHPTYLNMVLNTLSTLPHRNLPDLAIPPPLIYEVQEGAVGKDELTAGIGRRGCRSRRLTG